MCVLDAAKQNFSGFRAFPVGVAKYLTWPQTSWVTKVTCTHHIWTIPCLVLGSGELPFSAYAMSIFIVTSHVVLSHWLTPCRIPINRKKVGIERNSVGHVMRAGKCGGFSLTDKDEVKYLNINLSHELWPDLTFKWLEFGRNAPTNSVYLFRLLVVWQIFNLLVYFAALYPIAKAISLSP